MKKNETYQKDKLKPTNFIWFMRSIILAYVLYLSYLALSAPTAADFTKITVSVFFALFSLLIGEVCSGIAFEHKNNVDFAYFLGVLFSDVQWVVGSIIIVSIYSFTGKKNAV